MSFCASVAPSTPVQMLLSLKPLNAAHQPAGVGGPLVRREGGEVAGAAGRDHAGLVQRLVVGADAQLAEAAAEPDIGLVDLVELILALELDLHADLEPVVEHRVAEEMDFGVAEQAIPVGVVAELRIAVVVLVQHAVVVVDHHVGRFVVAADGDPDRLFGQGGMDNDPNPQQGGRAEQHAFHAAIPPNRPGEPT